MYSSDYQPQIIVAHVQTSLVFGTASFISSKHTIKQLEEISSFHVQNPKVATRLVGSFSIASTSSTHARKSTNGMQQVLD